jgi:hypothetical protein
MQEADSFFNLDLLVVHRYWRQGLCQDCRVRSCQQGQGIRFHPLLCRFERDPLGPVPSVSPRITHIMLYRRNAARLIQSVILPRVYV